MHFHKQLVQCLGLSLVTKNVGRAEGTRDKRLTPSIIDAQSSQSHTQPVTLNCTNFFYHLEVCFRKFRRAAFLYQSENRAEVPAPTQAPLLTLTKLPARSTSSSLSSCAMKSAITTLKQRFSEPPSEKLKESSKCSICWSDYEGEDRPVNLPERSFLFINSILASLLDFEEQILTQEAVIKEKC